jgi:hypothetical protein
MKKLETYLSILGMALPIIGCMILLWSDVQTIKVTKADYREVAELKTEMIGQLAKNTEAIDNLNQLIKMMLEERRANVK